VLDASKFPDAKFMQLEKMPDLKEVSGLEAIKIESLSLLSAPQLKSISGLANHPVLCQLQIGGCPALDSRMHTQLASLTKLRALGLGQIDLHGLEVLRECHDLQSIALSRMPRLTRIATLKDLKRLRKLCVTYCPRVDWSSLGDRADIEIFGDEWVSAALKPISDRHVGSEADFWRWREEMIQDNIKAERYYDKFID
jgi:hypothetical protein